MDYTTKIALAIGALVLLGIAWAIWKFFASLFKYFLIALAVIALGVGLTVYRMMPPTRNSAIGKYAYLKENGKYLGIIEGQANDNERGEVWSIRMPGSHPKIYSKSRVELKETFEPGTKQKEEPSPSPTASSPAAKGKKAVATKK